MYSNVTQDCSMLCLERLELRDYMLILLCLCKIVNGFVNCDVVHNLAYAKAVNTRGHRFK